MDNRGVGMRIKKCMEYVVQWHKEAEVDMKDCGGADSEVVEEHKQI